MSKENPPYDPVFYAAETAYDFIAKQDYWWNGREDFVLATMERALPYLLKYQADSPYMQDAIKFIDDYKKHIEQKRITRASIPVKRRGIADNYDTIFVTVGRRDGFCCTQCKAVYDLQLDHIVALISGGSNELGNLQLLCRTCNSRKGGQ
jgi:hypothetical protein